MQGTIYPDVVELSAPDRNKAEKIKSHHNVGGLPEDMQFQLVEPLRYLFKDEVRAAGEASGLPELMVRRSRSRAWFYCGCLGEETQEQVPVYGRRMLSCKKNYPKLAFWARVQARRRHSRFCCQSARWA